MAMCSKISERLDTYRDQTDLNCYHQQVFSLNSLILPHHNCQVIYVVLSLHYEEFFVFTLHICT